MKNLGVQLATPQAGAYLYGEIEKRILTPRSDWLPYLSHGEWQLGVYVDTMACVSFSALNCVEALFNKLWPTLSEDNKKWLGDNGYLTNGRMNGSDRFTAKMSGTTRQGNYLYKVADSIRHDGIVPESVWPFPFDQRNPVFDWDNFYSEIPDDIIELGKEFARRFNILYEQVDIISQDYPDKMTIVDALRYAPLQVVVYAWPQPINGIYPRVEENFVHAVALGKPEYFIEDSYAINGVFQKQLATDYRFYQWAFQYHVFENNKKDMNKNVKFLKDKNSSEVSLLLQGVHSPEQLAAISRIYGRDVTEQISNGQWNDIIDGNFEITK